MTMETYYKWKDVVKKTVRFVCRDFPNVDKDDVEQDLWVIILEKKSLKHPDDVGSNEILLRIVRQLCWKYRTQGLYGTSQYDYRPSDVRNLLETVFFPEFWEGTDIPEDAKSLSNDDRILMSADLSRAIDMLNDEQRAVLLMKYKYAQTPVHNSADHRRLSRAVDRVTDILNGALRKAIEEYEGPGTRKVMSNAESRERLRGD